MIRISREVFWFLRRKPYMHHPKTFLIVQYINIYSIYHGSWFWSGDDDGGRRVHRAVENSRKVQPARLEVINNIILVDGVVIMSIILVGWWSCQSSSWWRWWWWCQESDGKQISDWISSTWRYVGKVLICKDPDYQIAPQRRHPCWHRWNRREWASEQDQQPCRLS